MNKEQMDEFLQSIGGLKNGFKLESNPITDSDFFCVDSGWFPLIKDLISDLIKMGWNKEVIQVKEKFGTLRFYINEGTDDIHRRIAKAENESYIICEVTGQPGKLRNDLPWWRTLCDEEYFKIKNKQ
jgi:hypothetical protein